MRRGWILLRLMSEHKLLHDLNVSMDEKSSSTVPSLPTAISFESTSRSSKQKTSTKMNGTTTSGTSTNSNESNKPKRPTSARTFHVPNSSTGTPSLEDLVRPSSARSFSSGISSGMPLNQAYNELKAERDLLERMVQERDEKAKSLQKTIDMQKDYMEVMQTKYDKEQERQKQEATRQKIYLQSMTHEKNLIKNQLKVLQKENQRIKNDPIRMALSGSVPSSASSGDASPIGNVKDDNDSIDSLESEKPKLPDVKILDGDKRCLVLQSQLYQAMNSLSSLQQQTSALKESYDDIVSGLQRELIDAEEDKAKIEVKLLSRMAVLEREKTIIEELLQNKIKVRDTRIRILEKRVQNLDRIEDDESLEGDKGEDRQQKDEPFRSENTPSDNHTVCSITDKDKEDEKDSHEDINELLSELEMLSAHSSSRKLFSNVM